MAELSYDVRTRHAAQINAGYSARLDGVRKMKNPHIEWVEYEGSDKKCMPFDDKAKAWQHGWETADRDELRRNRKP